LPDAEMRDMARGDKEMTKGIERRCWRA